MNISVRGRTGCGWLVSSRSFRFDESQLHAAERMATDVANEFRLESAAEPTIQFVEMST